jgi:hypothetical protein
MLITCGVCRYRDKLTSLNLVACLVVAVGARISRHIVRMAKGPSKFKLHSVEQPALLVHSRRAHSVWIG